MNFKQCRECYEKPGSPVLCPSCLNNREVIHSLQQEISVLKGDKIPCDPIPCPSRLHENDSPGVILSQEDQILSDKDIAELTRKILDQNELIIKANLALLERLHRPLQEVSQDSYIMPETESKMYGG